MEGSRQTQLPLIAQYFKWLVLACCLVVSGVACSHIKPIPSSEDSKTYTLNVPWKQQDQDHDKATAALAYNASGRASWYGKKFHRRRTSSGERFNMYDLTAAHRTLPFGTRLRVTNISNGKSVVVRVNDRGPGSRKLIIDLSYAAAKRIGIISRGSGDVEIERLSGDKRSGKNQAMAPDPDDDTSAHYSVQAGSFGSRENAEKRLAEIEKDFDPVNLVMEKGVYKVRVGQYEDPLHAEAMKEKLTSRGYQVYTVKTTPDAIALETKRTGIQEIP